MLLRSRGDGTGLEDLGKEITLKLRCEGDMGQAMVLGTLRLREAGTAGPEQEDHEFIPQAT